MEPPPKYESIMNTPCPQPGLGYNPSVLVTTPPTRVRYNITTKPHNYMRMSLSTMLCFCFPFGIVALIYSSRVDPAWSKGDYKGAKRYSLLALKWNISGITTGSVLGVISAIAGITMRLVFYSMYDGDDY